MPERQIPGQSWHACFSSINVNSSAFSLLYQVLGLVHLVLPLKKCNLSMFFSFLEIRLPLRIFNK